MDIENYETIFLWENCAPDTKECEPQEQPALFPFRAEGSRGAVVVCPGGAYCGRAPHEGAPIARMLMNAGISAFQLQYRVKPCPHGTPLKDAQRAIRLVRSMGYEKVAILGFSAGGNLCCSAAVHYDAGNPEATDPIERFSCKPDVFIPCYAVASFGKYTHQGSVDCLLGKDANNEELLRFYSSEMHVTRETPPAFIWHTSDDDCVPVQNSLLLAKALADHGVQFELHVYPHGSHGLGLAQENETASDWSQDCARFLNLRGFGR